MDRELLLELKEFLTERMVDNMSTKDLVDYVSNDLFTYFDKLGEHEFLEEARNYWDDSFDEVVEEIKDYMKCDVKKGWGNELYLHYSMGSWIFKLPVCHFYFCPLLSPLCVVPSIIEE